ncbi:MAG: DUF3109 family protein [Myxococcales bacterium]|nr:DUF3109 family protein [Myxococcales bacterium]
MTAGGGGAGGQSDATSASASSALVSPSSLVPTGPIVPTGSIRAARAPLALPRAFEARTGGWVVRHVDPFIFRARYFAACMDCTTCHDWCCQWGCDVDRAQADQIVAELGPALADRFGDAEQWFGAEATVDADFPSGQYVSSRVVDGACVFRQRGGRGCGIHAHLAASGLDYHERKPTLCWLFPLLIDRGVLTGSGWAMSGDLVCAGSGPTHWQAQRGEVLWLFGPELVAVLDELAHRDAAAASLTQP